MRSGWLLYAALAAFAACHWHGLYADGAFIVVSLLSNETMLLEHSARVASQFLQQAPALLALHAGLDTLPALTTIYGLTLHAWPWIFSLTATLIVPVNHAGYRLFPWLGFFAGTLSAAFALVAEGPMTTGLFWGVLVTILFRARSTAGRIGLLAVAAPLMWMHEVLVFLAPVLALAAVLRAGDESSAASRRFFRVVAAWFVAVALYQFLHVVTPVSEANRGSFVKSLLGFRWLLSGSGVNFPLLLGIAMTVIVGANSTALLLAKGKSRHWLSLTATLLMSGLAVASVIAPLTGISVIEPSAQFAARNHPAFLSFALALLMLVLWRKGIDGAQFTGWVRPVLLSVLLAGSLGWHVVAQHEWSRAISAWRDVLQRSQGLVPWTDALATVTPRQRELLWTYSWGWTNPAMSLLLSPNGRVQAIVKDWKDPADRFSFRGGTSGRVPASRLWDVSALAAAASPSLPRDE